MKQQLFLKLLKDASFVLPASLVDKQRERLLEQARRRHFQMGATEADWKDQQGELEKEFAKQAEEQVRLYFILSKIAEKESIELDEAELHQRLNGLAQQSGRPLEEVRRVFEEDLRETLREKKTVDFLIANAKLEEK
jgi:trigger factor